MTLNHILTIQPFIRPDSGYPAKKMAGYPAAGYPANSASGVTLILAHILTNKENSSIGLY